MIFFDITVLELKSNERKWNNCTKFSSSTLWNHAGRRHTVAEIISLLSCQLPRKMRHGTISTTRKTDERRVQESMSMSILMPIYSNLCFWLVLLFTVISEYIVTTNLTSIRGLHGTEYHGPRSIPSLFEKNFTSFWSAVNSIDEGVGLRNAVQLYIIAILK